MRALASPRWTTCDILHSLHNCPQISNRGSDRVIYRMLCGTDDQVRVLCGGRVLATSKITGNGGAGVVLVAVGVFEDTTRA